MIEDLTLAKPRRRAPVFVWGNALVLVWLAVAVVLLVVGDRLGLPEWLPLHALLLGSATTAIVIWSDHFVAVLCRVPGASERHLARGLVAITLLVTAVLAGVVADVPVLTGVGGTGLAVIACVHAVVLLRRRRAALNPRFGYLIGFYAAASAALVAGAATGAALALGGDWYARVWPAHVHLTLLGWVGLSVLGTLFTLLPTALGTRMEEGTARSARWSLGVLSAGLVVAAAGMLLGWPLLAAAGLVGYAAGVGVALAPLVGALRRRRPRGPAGWMLSAATAWLAVAVVADAVRVAVVGPVGAVDPVLPVLVVGFVAQVLVGALTQLLPVVLGRGPAEHKELAAVLGHWWRARVVAANAAVPLVVVFPPVGWAVAALAFGVFVVLALSIAVPTALHGGARKVDRPQWVGLVAGLAAVVLAAGFATSGHEAPAAGGSRTVEVELDGMRVRPAVVEVPAGTRLVLRVTNREAMRHDLRVDGGPRTPLLRQGETATLDVGVVRDELRGWCTVAGHRAAGMTFTVRTTGGGGGGHRHGDTPDHGGETPDPGGDAATGLDLSARPGPGWQARDPRLAPAPAPTTHRVELRVVEHEVEVAPGRRQRAWTFGGTAPGPTLRGKVGDRFEITLVNDGTIGHSIDFHAGALAPDGPMRTIEPGERLVYAFTANRPGAWLYHCGTMPMSLHMANGMHGAVVIDPPDLAPADDEYLLVGSQLYLGEGDDQAAKVARGAPDGWAFNGMAAQYDHAPLTTAVGRRVRIWLVNAGPGDGIAFHVVGGQFDAVYKEGARWPTSGAQALDLAPAQGGYVELTFPEAGRYPFVDHDMRHAENGAHGFVDVTG
ncbi:multicopper oxidase domain-containing protein [Saccharothrix mutabilis subsp. mutabilis]|uniref:Copper-containing nitrite reductase n=1 Tax=Saccharothrix mutabilis subsp. mutabilis TaxID=66855 RepID=A0ABN0UHH8_9PSEU